MSYLPPDAYRGSAVLKQTRSQRKRLRRSFSPSSGAPSLLRVKFIGALFVSCFGLLFLRVIELQSLKQADWRELAKSQHWASVTVSGARGDIVDRHGRPLATSVETVSLGLHPRLVRNKARAREALFSGVGLERSAIDRALESEAAFVWLARGLARDVLKDTSLANSRFLSSHREFRRFYPFGSLAGQLLGRVGRDGNAQAGAELFLDQELKAAAHSFRVKRDAKGRFVAVSATNEESAGIYGESRLAPRDEGVRVYLSIDAVLQGILEDEFKGGKERAEAKEVFGLLLNADSGEVLAMASSESYDPNQELKAGLGELRNPNVSVSFEPGSTIKPLIVAAAISEGVVEADTILDCNKGRMRIGRHTIRDVHPEDRLSVKDSVVQSSNVALAQLGIKLGAERLYGYLKNFGFGRITGIELPGEQSGILRKPSQWSEVAVATHSFGHGFSVTALQLASAYASLLNGGKIVTPSVLKRSGVPELANAKVSKTGLNQKSLEVLRETLIEVVEGAEGTGGRAKLQGLAIGGKTGTAHKAYEGKKGYDPERVIASFVGFVDASSGMIDSPLVLVVVVDEPGTEQRWGGVLAAPIFRDTMARVVSHLIMSDSPGRFQLARLESRRNNRVGL